MITLAIAGKPNCGKSTFFTAATLADVEIANYPFTTIDANHGVAYVRTNCPCKELGIEGCTSCHDGVRYIPISLIDVAGLVPDAHLGRGLGNQFLDHLREADVILHVIDGSGGTDSEGNPVDLGSHDPANDIGFIHREMTMWIYGIIAKHWQKMQRSAQQKTFPIGDAVAEVLAGLGITPEDVKDAENEAGVDLRSCSDDDLIKFCEKLINISKPTVVIANKVDQAPAKMLESLKDADIGFASAASELALRKAVEGGFVSYLPGDPSFTINDEASLSAGQKNGLGVIGAIMEKFGGTGIQQAINYCVFDLMDQIVVYPVEDESKYCDGKGRVLPDAFLMKRGSNPHDMAYRIHSDIGDGFLYAINAKTKMRIKETQELKNGDVIKIVSAKK